MKMIYQIFELSYKELATPNEDYYSHDQYTTSEILLSLPYNHDDYESYELAEEALLKFPAKKDQEFEIKKIYRKN